MATVGKTFSDPDKWETGWFSRLSPGQKLLYSYMWQRCDHAGVIEFVPAVWSAHIGQNIDEESLKKLQSSVNTDKERLARFGDKFWFTEYIRFNQQSDPEKALSPNYSFHRHVFQRIQEHGITEEVQKRDPILLKDFVSVSQEETSTSKASVSLTEALPKSTGKGTSKGGGEGKGKGHPLNGVSEEELKPFKNFAP